MRLLHSIGSFLLLLMHVYAAAPASAAAGPSLQALDT
jgi:hypothetical protein